MVLGLIDFLLGGKKKTKTPKNAQVNSPLSNNVGNVSTQNNNNNITNDNNLPDGVNQVTDNNTLKFENSNENQSNQNPEFNNHQQQIGDRKSITEVISKIHSEITETNEKIAEMVGNIKNIENNVNDLGHKVDDLEEAKKITEDKITGINDNMTKFLSLYELVNNQYNPFVENVEKQQQQVVLANGDSENNEDITEKIKQINLNSNPTETKEEINENNFKSSLLELDTLNIEEAAGDAVPLTNLKNNTNSLVIILSWLEYLIKKVGINETRNSLRYYTETLRWTTPEVFFELDKYLRGMKDKSEISEEDKLTVRDHIVSLYFISKLNEKKLDEKLTKAVLEIIKN